MSNENGSPRDTPLLGHVKLGGDYDPSKTRNLELIQRRREHFAGSFLFYHDPVHIVRGQGVWLFDDRGRRYLDCYNNVPSVGHCHPKVVRALTQQATKLNTHTRYLHEGVVNLARDLAATFPGKLGVGLFVCTGTEACELAMRIARTVTGRNGCIVMENAYHGNSRLVGEMSTALYPKEKQPPHIAAVEPPNTYQGPFRRGEYNLGEKYADLVDGAIRKLENNGEGLAAFVCDSIFDSQGVLEAPPDYFQNVYRKVRQAGGLCIADEVQSGFCRTGKYWGFENYDVIPDIAFTGKPMGDGHPVAAVFTTREIADVWESTDIYFNTFGGNPVSAAAARATIDVIRQERILENVRSTGAYLRTRLEKLVDKHAIIGDVKGRGLFQAIELVKDRGTREPAAEVARLLPDAMKEEGVLLGLSGRYGDTLKIRPPMVFDKTNADQLIRSLDKVLSNVAKFAAGAADTKRVHEGVLTERAVLELTASGENLISVGQGVVITPLARDKARELGVTIERDNF